MLTRRTLAAGLANLPEATAAASVAVDPIHGALLRHRVTKAVLGLIDEVAEPARYAAAKQELSPPLTPWLPPCRRRWRGPGVGQLHDRER